MQKIPLSPEPDSESSTPATPPTTIAPRFLLDALEVLLLGAVWIFLLVWMPFFQQEHDGVVPPAVQKVQWVIVLGLALVLMLMHLIMSVTREYRWLRSGVLLGMGVLSALMLWQLSGTTEIRFSDLVASLQALLGLAYFVAGRLKAE